MNEDTSEGILSPGEVLNNTYVIAELVASGGTGEVYRATNRVSGREIAIKILKREFAQDEQFANLMKREASVLHELITEGVVRYYDLLESDLHGGFLFIVMEFIHGDSLNVNMKNGNPLSAGVVIKIAHRVLLGLHAAHTQNLYHRDLSPDNIILKDNDPSKATLIDFGIAKDVNEGAKTIIGGGFAGKYQYAAPEQMEGTTDGRSDLYSLGVTLLGAFRGRRPGHGATLVEILDAKNDKPDISGVPEPLYGLFSRLMEPNPDNRFQTAEEALVFLETSGAPVTTNVPFTTAIPRSFPPRSIPPRTLPPEPAPAPAEMIAETTKPPQRPPQKPAPKPAAKPVEKKSRTGLLVTVVLLLGLAAGGGAWYMGLLGPILPVTPVPPVADTEPTPAPEPEVKAAELPIAAPFVLTLARSSGTDPIAMRGNLPSAAFIPIITKLLKDGLETSAVRSDITAARGQPFENWPLKIVEIALKFKRIDQWTVAASDKTVTLSGTTQTAAEKSALLGAARTVMNGLDVTIVDKLTVAVPPVQLLDINRALLFLRTCGTLTASGGSGGFIAADDTINVTGLVAKFSDISRVRAMMTQAVPGRSQNLSLQVINPGVCSVVQVLPSANSKSMKISYSYGTSEREVQAETYKLGENPVIDIELDASIKGYLDVIFVDFGDQVFHLMPHQARPENNLEKIGKVVNGKRIIRAAFPISEASVAQLGFKVVEPIGSNMIVAIVSPEPLFDKLRPRAESNAAFVESVRQKLRAMDGVTGFATYRPLITEP